MPGFIIETPNQCWHVTGNSTLYYIADYADRQRLPPSVFTDQDTAQAVMSGLKACNGERGSKLKVIAN